jgi:hypothetical protein
MDHRLLEYFVHAKLYPMQLLADAKQVYCRTNNKRGNLFIFLNANRIHEGKLFKLNLQ